MVYGCSCKLNVMSTGEALEFFDMMKLASTASSMNVYSSFRDLLISSLNSQFSR